MSGRAKPVVRRRSPVWECVIVGAGPAGLSAAVYMGRFRRRTLVVDDADGRWSYGQVNENYLGFPAGVSARRLHALGRAQAGRFGVQFESATVRRVRRTAAGFRVQTSAGSHAARTVIWATGVRDRWPEVPGVRRLVGRVLFWCIVCDGWRTRDKTVVLLGNTERAVGTALQFLTYTRKVTFLMDCSPTRLPGRCRVRMREGRIPIEVGHVRRIRQVEDGVALDLQGGRRLAADYVFSLYGSEPRVAGVRDLPLRFSRLGYVRIDDKNRTAVPGFFAAGDVSDKHAHQVAAAVQEGAQAAMAANFVLYPPLQRI
jgi:thioredoxin reductase (NADPH)